MSPQENTPLSEVLQMGLEKYLDDLTAISSQASKEFALEKVQHIKHCLINTKLKNYNTYTLIVFL